MEASGGSGKSWGSGRRRMVGGSRVAIGETGEEWERKNEESRRGALGKREEERDAKRGGVLGGSNSDILSITLSVNVEAG